MESQPIGLNDVGKAFVFADDRPGSDEFGVYHVLQAVGDGTHPIGLFWTFDIEESAVVGKRDVSRLLTDRLEQVDLPSDTIAEGVSASRKYVAGVQAEHRRRGASDRRHSAEMRAEYDKPDSYSFLDQGKLATKSGIYVLWADWSSSAYYLEARLGDLVEAETVSWSHPPTFGIDIEDHWKLFGDAEGKVSGVLANLESRIKRRAR
ncbi:MAG: hypothetical protein ACLFP4_09500 [Spirochaetales bacterium]